MITPIFPSLVSFMKSLMSDTDINEAELARKTNVPQATINRILLGITRDPRISTMSAIADVFGVTIDQLIGKESLPNPVNGINKNNNYKNFIPIIEWHEIIDYVTSCSINCYTHSDWILIDRKNTDGCFALKSTQSMKPKFRLNSTLIVEACDQLKDDHIVIVSFNNKEPTIRRIKKDGEDIYLIKLNPDRSDLPAPIKPSDKIIGVVTESRMNYKK